MTDIIYQIYSAELQSIGFDEDQIDDYAELLQARLEHQYPNRRVNVRVIADVTGYGSGATYCDIEDRDYVEDVANSVLDSMPD